MLSPPDFTNELDAVFSCPDAVNQLDPTSFSIVELRKSELFVVVSSPSPKNIVMSGVQAKFGDPITGDHR